MNKEEARKELYKWLTEYYNKIYSKKDLTNDKKYERVYT